MMSLLCRECHIAEYASLRNALFNEYFENRMYLLETYLHALGRTFEADGVTASEFLGAFLAKYLRLISDEQKYFTTQFNSQEDYIQKWQVFRRENEYDIIQKRIRPWILGCIEIKEVCQSIDVLNKFMGTNPNGGILN